MRNDTEKSTDALWKKNERGNKGCPLFGKCGSCRYLDLTYRQQLAKKQKLIRRLMEKHCEVNPILGMEDPWYYRHKVQAVFGEEPQAFAGGELPDRRSEGGRDHRNHPGDAPFFQDPGL